MGGYISGAAGMAFGARGRICSLAQVGAVVALEAAVYRIPFVGIQWPVVGRARCAVALVALNRGPGRKGRKSQYGHAEYQSKEIPLYHERFPNQIEHSNSSVADRNLFPKRRNRLFF